VTDSIPDALAGWPVVLRIPVQWGEMDAYGHVNNTVLFRYFESARVEYLVRCGFARSWEVDRIGAILQSTGCRFRRPLFFPDMAIVAGRSVELEDDRFTMEYAVISESSGEVVAEGAGVVVSYDYDSRRKCDIPDAVASAIRALEGWKGDGCTAE
jgi:acyl-CoA thioester hydrolase